MDAQDGQVPAPRRPAAPRRRPSSPADPAALPFAVPGEPEPRVAGLSELLADIDALRLTLQTDLSLAAAALEAGADSLAGELVDSDLADVRAFGARAADRLSRLEQAAGEIPSDVPDEVPVTTPLRRRRIMSAGPLMAAAAALIGFVAFVPDRGGVATPETQMTSATMAGIELSRLAQAGAPDEELRLAAEELNDELAQLIAQAADDPAAAQQALMLLETTTAVLSSQGDSGVLRSVMAETRALRERLRDSVTVVAARPARPTRVAVRQVVPAVPRIVEQPEKERSSSPAPAPKSSPKPSPSSEPTPAPTTPAPAPSPSSEPSPAPSSGPSEPSPGSDGPLPNPGQLPGL